MITIDGSQGEGGGQVLRSSLALSLVTGRSVTVENIRVKRSKPGLMRQHLTAVRAAQDISDAEIEGAELGSTRLVLRPGTVRGGEYRFRVGTAGSTTLVLQAILPALMTANGPSNVELKGGTHNPLAPPFDFLARAYLPLLRRMGASVELGSCVPGFHPAGGGRFNVRVQPTPMSASLHLVERGALVRPHVRAVVANLPKHIADRECRAIAKQTAWDASCFSAECLTSSIGAGNVVMIELQYANVTELFTAFGERGKRAERVASDAWRQAERYLKSGAPVGEFLGDQLMLPMALAAHAGHSGVFRTVLLSRHSTTHIEILQQFLDILIDVSDSQDQVVVRFAPH